MRLILAASIAMVLLLAERSAAAQDGPVIVSEQIQRLAVRFSVAERLGIDWGMANPMDSGDYIGTLAAGEELAREIAVKNGRIDPNNEDYVAALLSLCFISNKPPLLSEYRPRIFPAYYSTEVRTMLIDAMGPIPVALPDVLIETFDQESVVDSLRVGRIEFPNTEQEYFEQVIDRSRFPEQ